MQDGEEAERIKGELAEHQRQVLLQMEEDVLQWAEQADAHPRTGTGTGTDTSPGVASGQERASREEAEEEDMPRVDSR